MDPSNTRTADEPALFRWLALGDSFTIGTGIGADLAFPAERAAALEGPLRPVE